MELIDALGAALSAAFAMFWQVLWPLGLGFLLSALVETLVSKRAVSRVLGADSVGATAAATAMGAASSSCSYAAVATARSLFRKGATLANAVIFEFASTNLVFELGLVLVVLLGWRFLLGELSGGLLMVVLLAVAFRWTLRPGLVARARAQAEQNIAGRMEGHGAMDMSVTGGSLLGRVFSDRAYTAICHYYFMTIASLWLDLGVGLLIAGAISAWVPPSVWPALFLGGHGMGGELWGAVIGPVIAALSFVCSVGNIPLAAVLWRHGISFSGVIAFIFGDLLIIPILDIYRRYYGGRVAAYLALISYVTMVLAGLTVGVIFRFTGTVSTVRVVTALQARPTWDYATVLDLIFLGLTAVLGVRFLQTGGPAMLREMEHAPSEAQAP